MRKQSLTVAVANTLGLKRQQVIDICWYGDIHLATRTQAIREVKAVELSLIEASEIWGLKPSAGSLRKHAFAKTMATANKGPYSRHNPRRVTVAAMLDLMAELNRPSHGFGA